MKKILITITTCFLIIVLLGCTVYLDYDMPLTIQATINELMPIYTVFNTVSSVAESFAPKLTAIDIDHQHSDEVIKFKKCIESYMLYLYPDVDVLKNYGNQSVTNFNVFKSSLHVHKVIPIETRDIYETRAFDIMYCSECLEVIAIYAHEKKAFDQDFLIYPRVLGDEKISNAMRINWLKFDPANFAWFMTQYYK